MVILTLLIGYLVIRPLLTLATELPRALAMMRWEGKWPVTVFLGTHGHSGAWHLRLGRLILRIHPLFFLLRGSISDAHSRPKEVQFIMWCLYPILVSLLIFATCITLFVMDPGSATLRLLVGGVALLSLIDSGAHIFRETKAQTLHCGLVSVGNGATLRLRIRYGKRWLDYLQGLRAYLRDDFSKALDFWQPLLSRIQSDTELLEYAAYAALVLGRADESLGYYHRLDRSTRESVGQHCVAAMALIKAGKAEQALDLLNKTLEKAAGNPMARNLRAWIFLQQGDLKNASLDLSVATRTPEYATAWANLAVCHEMEGNLADAKKAILNAIEMDPFDLNILIVQHQVALLEGNLAEKERIWKKFMQFPQANIHDVAS